MTPGRELDALVAEKVFGAKDIQWSKRLKNLLTGEEFLDPFYKFESQTRYVPKYSTDIAAAGPILEKFKAEGNYKLEISAYPKDGIWTIKAYHRDGYSKLCTTSASTIAHAICLAALKALEA